MFTRVSRPIISYANIRLSHIVRNTHRFGGSAIYTHYSFPATLFRLNAGVAFKQFWFERQAQSDQLSIHDNLGESKDDLRNADVWTNCLGPTAAMLMPDTFTMQEIIRTAADNCLEDEENGVSVERPFIFTIPKGTILPTTLVLRRENVSQFSLQPSLPTSSNDLNNILDEFYSTYADKRDVIEWLHDHKYENAIACENEREWMAR
ncbi:hypothetical protein K505DRAFT_404737 [Melanomma pulvis-pyrius CBS 109.77]|uniref:Tse2 ADP-ribosyltransferase toxin domain-containing protein n=1 Tax=Melanomma pulvis-pyrius CBS 109.77 TaxID=1314802 RepID=A0A6A6XT76_9PLEO|nr:hypothetical protein K505DRAFT_404737 [Melanomma pulvis-pyrius CBS 109.77]